MYYVYLTNFRETMKIFFPAIIGILFLSMISTQGNCYHVNNYDSFKEVKITTFKVDANAETIKAAFLMSSVPLHGMQYPIISADGIPTGRFVTTDEEMDAHCMFIHSMGFLSDDEVPVTKLGVHSLHQCPKLVPHR